MGLNTYPSNPFPPSTDRMDADALETEVSKLNSDVSELRSGLTNVDNDTKLNTQDLTTPSRSKNILPITLDILKRFNTQGTWNGNTYTNNGTVYVVSTNSEGYVTKINVSGTPQGAINYFKLNDFIGDGTSYILSGCPYNGQTWSYAMFINFDSTLWDKGDGVTFNNVGTGEISIRVAADYAMPSGGLDYYPMIRPATITDPTFAPYIPSVESRIEALEKPSNIIAILTAGANVNAAVLGVILPKDVQTATITRVIPLGGTGVDVNLPLTVTNYDYESIGVIDGSSSAVGSDNLLNIAREYCTQVNISLTY